MNKEDKLYYAAEEYLINNLGVAFDDIQLFKSGAKSEAAREYWLETLKETSSKLNVIPTNDEISKMYDDAILANVGVEGYAWMSKEICIDIIKKVLSNTTTKIEVIEIPVETEEKMSISQIVRTFMQLDDITKRNIAKELEFGQSKFFVDEAKKLKPHDWDKEFFAWIKFLGLLPDLEKKLKQLPVEDY